MLSKDVVCSSVIEIRVKSKKPKFDKVPTHILISCILALREELRQRSRNLSSFERLVLPFPRIFEVYKLFVVLRARHGTHVTHVSRKTFLLQFVVLC